MEEVGLGLLMQGMGGIGGQGFLALELGIQGIIHAAIGLTNLHFQKTRNLAHQRFQNGGDNLNRFRLIDAFLECVQNNVLNHLFFSCRFFLILSPTHDCIEQSSHKP